MLSSSLKHILHLCNNYHNIFIYGAGQNAKRLYTFFDERGIKIAGFIVSNINENPENLFGLPVIEVIDYQNNPESLIFVSIAKGYEAYSPLFNSIVESGLHNVFFLSLNILLKIKEEVTLQRLKEALNKDIYHLKQNHPVESYHNILSMTHSNGLEYYWRFRTEMIEQQNIINIIDLFPAENILQQFEHQYGAYNLLHTLNTNNKISRTNYSVYMAQSHLDKINIQETFPNWIIPIQVGAALTDKKICSICDNTGDHISERNPIYSECTALYWVWKNAPKTDYIGLCHYRRHFNMSEKDFYKLEASNIDVLVTTPTFVNEDAGTFFSRLTPQMDIIQFLNAFKLVHPEYLPDAEEFFNAKFFPPCNLSIMKYELFQKYMDFVFSITFEIEHYYDDLGFHRNDRYMGFLVECLLGIFLMHHKDELKIAYTDMLFYS